MAVLLLLPSVASAAAQRPTADPDGLVFVGQSSGSPSADLDAADLELLLVCREPLTLDQVLARGIPFRASRIDHLEGLGLLTQQGQRFGTTIPVLLDDDRDAVDSWAADAASGIAASTADSLRTLGATLASRGHPHALASVASWLLEERVWDELIGAGVLDLPGLTRSQQRSYPERGWWGALWYVEPRPESPQRVLSLHGRDRSLLAAWNADPRPTQISGDSATGQFMGLLEAVRNDRLELRSPERFEDLREIGLIVGEETLNAPFLRWDPSREGNIARQVQTVTSELVLSVSTSLQREPPSVLTAADPTVAATVLYQFLAPRLLESWAEAGLDVLVLEPGTIPMTANAAEGDGQDFAPVTPRGVSVVVWEDLPRSGYPQFAFPVRR